MRSVAPDPSRGGARGYDEHFRSNQIALHNQGQHQLLTASRTSLWRWRSNGIQRRKVDGNVAATTLRDNEDQLLLVLCRLAHPKAKADEIIAFIARNNSTGHIYSRVEITRAESFKARHGLFEVGRRRGRGHHLLEDPEGARELR